MSFSFLSLSLVSSSRFQFISQCSTDLLSMRMPLLLLSLGCFLLDYLEFDKNLSRRHEVPVVDLDSSNGASDGRAKDVLLRE